MKGLARLSDTVSTNAGTGTIIEGSSNTFIEGKPAARLGDKHSVPGIIESGSPTVFINGIPVARLGDLTLPPGAVTSASSTVLTV